ncbi:unnamed protein product [Allacma fusca]|uniref:Glucose-methanol-choline oxidoreductase N-terminal domain-containing protein n=1 Tax=Allacma fusca TaxID=39272 RepID=A0A8J2KW22_9HEXA|nr:unnamed protein product [Allacma fusca]
MTLASKLLLTSLPLLISLYANRYREIDRLKAFPDDPSDFNLPVLESFDYIIVGGGTGGCVVARRLADANFKVLLLETGVPQRNIGQRVNGIVQTPVGKMLGGSSMDNSMIYQRGSPFDYNGWAELTGDSSWRYPKLLKYFRKFENYMGNFSWVNTDQHGFDGPITITSPHFPQSDIWLQAGEELSFPITDANGPQTIGFSPATNFINFGRRVSTYEAYIKPVEKSYEGKLDVRRYSPVSKVLFEKKIARGVLYHRHGIPRVATASKEVILCTGTFVTPILLIKSGIGSKEDLYDAKAKPIVISPQVGKNLHDHIALRVTPFTVKDPSRTWSLIKNLSFSDFNEFLYEGKGFVGLPGTNGVAYITSRRDRKENPYWPDLQLNFDFQHKDTNVLDILLLFGRPYSRGTIKFNTSATSMEDNNLPIIDPHYLEERSDMDVLLDGIDFIFKIFEGTQTFKDIGTQFTTEPIEPCKNTKFRSKDYWACYIKQRGSTFYHSSGTCRMGKPNDIHRSVVDSKLRVHGVEKLRIIDASVIPRIPNANLAAAVLAIAEKTVASIIAGSNKTHYSR